LLPTWTHPAITPEEHGIFNEHHQPGAAVYRQAPSPPGAARGAAVALFALITLAAAPVASRAAPHIETDTELATAGYYQLRWSATTTDVELQVSEPENGSASIIYTGPDRARVISGQTDGTRVYRVRELGAATPSAWSAPVSVTVAHHSLGRALVFFSIGALVFLATLALIVRGARSDG
jgi:hypothetical protein